MGTHEKQSRALRKKRLTWWKLLLIALAALLVIAAAAGMLFVESKLNKIRYSDGRSAAPLSEEADPEEETVVDISGLERVEGLILPEGAPESGAGVVNLLLLGTDDRDLTFSDKARADSCMLISLDPKKGSGKLVSFERGMGVLMVSGPHEGGYDLLTHCFRYGGADLMLQVIQTHFQVDVDRYVRVNLNTFIKIIDALGGVDVDITEEELWYLSVGADYRGDNDDEELPLVAGVNHLNGRMALAYARLRRLGGDWQRIVRQRTVIQACFDRLKNADLITLNRLCDECLPLVQTNLTKTEILQLLLMAPKFLNGTTFEQLTIPAEGTYGGMGTWNGGVAFAPDLEVNTRILHEFLYGEK